MLGHDIIPALCPQVVPSLVLLAANVAWSQAICSGENSGVAIVN